MSKDKQATLVIASRLLGYPSDQFVKELKDIQLLIEDAIESTEIKEEFQETLKFLSVKSLRDIQELYVETFDLKTKTGLYLTAHEMGDSNRRGLALIKLQKIINEAGFERLSEELVDYIPMLMEFLAVAPDSNEKDRLEYRLAVVLQRIRENLAQHTPYSRILKILMNHVFPNPSKEEIEQLENNREEADLEELPYPIMYQ
ncbi:nitrate reductase molybdenum cofactor assembly chaperone [Ornithinibacillus halotolerans]|uniref:Nitrate reductase molybdenum cofactor assembly chaperone n=1 Tax=Ornithinibacillus halotolerans TaxID=1274357 RepID=A0A916S4X6_9BACI|nr:nitrate reductase molybdenum cofactor assembly chaperone [Ornithinibacillus halotolerans]GGA81622.1 hypothetical protein GCM10008025_26140 [Ornithinibacillus halotolerans]